MGPQYVVYCIYQRYHITPRYIKAAMANKIVHPEIRLEIGLMGSLFIPASVLIFGFTSRASIHWLAHSYNLISLLTPYVIGLSPLLAPLFTSLGYSSTSNPFLYT
jgi:hypothetical protein